MTVKFKALVATTSLILLTPVFCTNAFAKSWRGIVPLYSTRADVERILGKPTRAGEADVYFRLRDYLVFISYQTASCSTFTGQFGYEWDVPRGTVVAVGVMPTQQIFIGPLLSGGNFKRQEYDLDFVYFIDDTNGLEIETHNGRVTLMTYTPEKAEDHLRCPKVTQCCLDIWPKFDEYATLPFADEKARLDNFAVYTLNGIARGAIVFYGENPAVRRKLLKRALRAKNYLVKVRGLEPERLFVLDGGYKAQSTTELQLKSITGLNSTMIFFPEKDPAISH